MIKKILEEREKTHGDYENVATTAQEIKDAIHIGVTYYKAPSIMKESLDLFATKMARIVNGNFENLDHWEDIIGYAQLVVNTLKEQVSREK